MITDYFKLGTVFLRTKLVNVIMKKCCLIRNTKNACFKTFSMSKLIQKSKRIFDKNRTTETPSTGLKY